MLISGKRCRFDKWTLLDWGAFVGPGDPAGRPYIAALWNRFHAEGQLSIVPCQLSIELWLDRFLHLFEENVQHSFCFPKTIPIFGHPTVI